MLLSPMSSLQIMKEPACRLRASPASSETRPPKLDPQGPHRGDQDMPASNQPRRVAPLGFDKGFAGTAPA